MVKFSNILVAMRGANTTAFCCLSNTGSIRNICRPTGIIQITTGALVALLALSSPSWGQEAPSALDINKKLEDWSISGSNTLHLEGYRVKGDESQSPFTDEGFQPYNDFDLNFARRISPFEEVRGDVTGTVNWSPYRAAEENLVLERINLTWEKGDIGTPLRVEAGDFYGFFSFRTLQRTLKGVQVDFQPLESISGERHALQILSGITDSNYRDIDADSEVFSGASWLVETKNYGTYSFNAVNNFRQADPLAGLVEREQWVHSVAVAHSFEAYNQKLNVEGELARFEGDVDLGTRVEEDRTGYGQYISLDGRAAIPLTYSARYQDYEDGFRPNGAVITPNRRSLELRSGYDFGEGRRVNGRHQRLSDFVEGGPDLDTTVTGVTVSSPLPELFPDNSTIRFDAFTQNVKTVDSSTRIKTNSAKVDMAIPMRNGWVGRTGLTYQTSENVVSGTNSKLRQIDLGGDKGISIGEFNGTVSPGLFVRTQDGASQGQEYGPSVALSLTNGPHSLNGNLSTTVQQRAANTDVKNFNLTTAYEFTKGSQSFGGEVGIHRRLPEGALIDTDSFKVAFYWRIAFNKPAKVAAEAVDDRPAVPVDTTAPGEFRLRSILPGAPIAVARALLLGAGYKTDFAQPSVIVNEMRLLPNIDQRQRHVVTHANRQVIKSALIIDFDDPTDATHVSRTLARVQEELIKRYGAPTRTFNIGSISASLVNDVNNGLLINNVEWKIDAGTIRFGIPRRLDRQVRIEIQFGRAFRSPRDTLWSIEEVR